MTGARKQPTRYQVAAWDALDRMTAKNKFQPSARELMQALGCNSTSTIMERLYAGVRLGRVVMIRNGAGPHFVPAWWDRMVTENMSRYFSESREAQ